MQHLPVHTIKSLMLDIDYRFRKMMTQPADSKEMVLSEYVSRQDATDTLNVQNLLTALQPFFKRSMLTALVVGTTTFGDEFFSEKISEAKANGATHLIPLLERKGEDLDIVFFAKTIEKQRALRRKIPLIAANGKILSVPMWAHLVVGILRPRGYSLGICAGYEDGKTYWEGCSKVGVNSDRKLTLTKQGPWTRKSRHAPANEISLIVHYETGRNIHLRARLDYSTRRLMAKEKEHSMCFVKLVSDGQLEPIHCQGI